MRPFLFHDKLRLAVILSFKLFYAAGFGGFALVLQSLVNLATAPDTTTGAFLGAVGLSVLYTAAVIGLMIYKDRLTAVYVNKALQNLRDALTDKLLAMRCDDYAQNDSALYLSRLTNDMKTVGTNYFSAVMALPDQIFTFVFAVAAAFFINAVVAVVMLGLTLLIFLVPLIFNKPLNRANLDVSERIKDYTKQLKQTFLGMDVVKNCNAQESVGALLREANARLAKRSTALETLSAFTMDAGIFIVVLLQLGSIAIAGYMYLQHVILIGAVIAVVQLGSSMYQPLMETAAKAALISGVKDLNETVLAILDARTEHKTRDLPASSAIAAVDLRYAYEPGEPVLSGVTAEFLPGQKVLVVGGSGSGKSTLLRLLGKMHGEFGGELTFGGVSYRELTEGQLYERIAIAHQSSYVFERSVRGNIDFNGTGDEARLQAAVAAAELTEFAARTGLDTVVDEEVNQISGGEKQRIGLARALYRDSDVLLLDEITSSLDKDTARAVEESLLGLTGKTVVHVSHKLFADLAARYDKILIVENGRVTAFAPPAELLDAECFRLYLTSAD